MKTRSLASQRSGVAAVELAFVLPFIMFLLLGLWEVGRMVEIQQIMSNAAREGVRQGATGNYTNSQVQTIVTNYLTEAGLPVTHAVVTVTDVTQGGDVSAANYLDRLNVSASIPFSDVRWSMLSTIVAPGTLITGQATWITMLDKAFPGFTDPPAG